MTGKFSRYQREYIKQLLIESEVQRFTMEETQAYVKDKLKQDISIAYLHTVKRNIKKSVGTRLAYLQKHRTAFIAEFFNRADEVRKYQRDLWQIYHDHPTDGHLQKDCLRELHQLTITLGNMYVALPAYSGLSLQDYFSEDHSLGSNRGQQASSTGTRPESAKDYKPVV